MRIVWKEGDTMRFKKTSPRWKFVMLGVCLMVMVTICAITTLLMQHQQQWSMAECDNYVYSEQYSAMSKGPQQNGSGLAPAAARGHQMHQVCNHECARARRPRLVPVLNGRVNMSTCDDQATARGPGQKVVAYSLYGQMYSTYFNGTPINVKAVAKMYPGWTMRLYHDLDLEDDAVSEVLCDLWCNNDHLDMCDVRQLPSGLGDQRKLFGMIWRFFVMGDPLVERFLIRDIDSMLLQREVDAVHDWSQSGATWHIMRDHRYHTVPILGGMWGGTNGNLEQNLRLRQALIKRGMPVKKRGLDQDLLKDILWPLAKNDMVAHDSYLCKKFNTSRPFPTQRQTMEFVGDKFPWEKNKKFKVEECPKGCRPKNHTDWKYC